MKKDNSKRKRIFPILLVFGILIIILLAVVKIILHKENQKEDTISEETMLEQPKEEVEAPETEAVITELENIDLGEQLLLVNAGSYSGTYVEDGTDENVYAVMAITVQNMSNSWLEYAEITVCADEENYSFKVSALPAGEQVRLLEQSRKEYEKAEKYEVQMHSSIFYQERPSLREELFEISAKDLQITIKNISETDITGDIYVYYKTKVEDIFVGGITYRAKATGGLMAGEEAQLYAGHYMKDYSEILFVTYAK